MFALGTSNGLLTVTGAGREPETVVISTDLGGCAGGWPFPLDAGPWVGAETGVGPGDLATGGLRMPGVAGVKSSGGRHTMYVVMLMTPIAIRTIPAYG